MKITPATEIQAIAEKAKESKKQESERQIASAIEFIEGAILDAARDGLFHTVVQYHAVSTTRLSSKIPEAQIWIKDCRMRNVIATSDEDMFTDEAVTIKTLLRKEGYIVNLMLDQISIKWPYPEPDGP
jgi:hypothetical protein